MIYEALDGLCPEANGAHSSGSCGTLACEEHLGLFKTNMDELMAGLPKCKDNLIGPSWPELWNRSSEIQSMMKNRTQECGFTWEDLPVVKVTSKKAASGAKQLDRNVLVG